MNESNIVYWYLKVSFDLEYSISIIFEFKKTMTIDQNLSVRHNRIRSRRR